MMLQFKKEVILQSYTHTGLVPRCLVALTLQQVYRSAALENRFQTEKYGLFRWENRILEVYWILLSLVGRVRLYSPPKIAVKVLPSNFLLFFQQAI